MIAHNPLHGSGQAELPHPALALGNDAHAVEWIRMTDMRPRQPASDEALHTIPRNAAPLATSRKRAMPESAYLESKDRQCRCVHGHSVVADVTTYHRLQPLALFQNGCMHAPPKLDFDLVELRLQPLADRLPKHGEPSVTLLLYANVRKAEKVERLRFPLSTPLPVFDRKRTEFQQPRLLGMQLHVELPHSLAEFRPKRVGIRFPLEAKHDIVRKTHHDDLPVSTLSTPCLDPQIEHIMEVHVGQQGRGTSPLGRPFLHAYSLPILQHASVQPFLDEPHDAPICHPMLDEHDQPFVGDPIEVTFNVEVEHPVHLSRQQSRVEGIQRLMLAAPWPEPVREAEKIRFVDGVQHLNRCALDDLVFQRRNSERPLPPVGLRYVHPSHRLGSVRSSFQPMGEILEIILEGLAVVPPCLPVHTWRGFLFQTAVGHAQRFEVVDVVQERREPQLLILLCCLTYPLERTGRVFPARCPGRVLLEQVPFGQTASLHPLRYRLPGIVRGLLRYYRSVRLPRSVRHRRASFDFPMRPRATASLGKPGISRFPREVFTYVHGVSDRAGFPCTSRYRCKRRSLPLSPTASASRRIILTRLNTRPARSPVNASTPPLRAAPHDSGPMWVAEPLSHDFFIHYTSPV